MTVREWGQLLLSLPYGLLFVLVIHRLIGLEGQWWRRAVLFAGCMLVSCLPIYVGDAVNILGVLPVFFLCVWLCCRGSGAARVSMTLILFPIAMSINAVVDTAMMLRSPFVRLALKTLLWLFIWLVVRQLLPQEIPELKLQLWAMIDVLAALPLLTVVCIVALGDGQQQLTLSEWILLPVCAVVSIALLFAVVLLSRQEKLERESQLFRLRNLYHEILEREQWQVRRLRHDMANHLQTMASLDGPAAKAYLRELIESPAMNTATRFCENEVANTVLSSKAAHMDAQQIPFACRAEIPSGLPMKDIDLCAVLANGLDNAIEACVKLSVRERDIALKAAVSRGVFALEIRNASLPPAQTVGGRIVSSKANRQRHGFGLASIREIADRYQGTLEYGHRDGVFWLLFSILTDRTASFPDTPTP